MLVIASDHGGLDLKRVIAKLLTRRGFDFADYGTDSSISVDYPDYAAKVAQAVSSGKAEAGILICGTGIGMAIVANKFPGIRAALVHDELTARMAKEHNNANILVLGGRVLSLDVGCRLVELWLDSTYEGGRHQHRLDKLAALEGPLS